MKVWVKEAGSKDYDFFGEGESPEQIWAELKAKPETRSMREILRDGDIAFFGQGVAGPSASRLVIREFRCTPN